MSYPDSFRCERPEHCPGSVDVRGAVPDHDDVRFCDTCGGRHEVRFEDAAGGRYSVRGVDWAPESSL